MEKNNCRESPEEEKNEIAEEQEEVAPEGVPSNLELGGKNKSEIIKLETIRLNPKDINIENSKVGLSKSDYAKYGFIFFCIFLSCLFLLKKQKYQNEFR